MNAPAVDQLPTAASGWWPGVFSVRLHRVEGINHERLHFPGRTFGIGDCGAVCVPASNTRIMRPRCAKCANPP
jgi:hypothetical protein